MDLLALDAQALESTRAFVHGTGAGQLDLPTPCAEWDVRALLNHVLGNNDLYGTAAAGGGADWERRHDDRVGDDHRSAYDRSADAVTAEFAAVDMAREVTMPFGPLLAAQAIAVHFVDVLAHGWDLAVATGQDATLDAGLCDVAMAIVAAYPPDVWGDPQFFAHRVPAADGDPAHLRLVRMLGRQP
jgi:uncharacterized protein (TIGR03086 family)